MAEMYDADEGIRDRSMSEGIREEVESCGKESELEMIRFRGSIVSSEVFDSEVDVSLSLRD